MLSVSCSPAASTASSLISVATAAAAAILHTLLWLLCSGLPLWFFRAAWGKKKIQSRFHLSLTSPVPPASLQQTWTSSGNYEKTPDGKHSKYECSRQKNSTVIKINRT